MRIVIAEDAALLREGLTHILTHFGHQVTAVADAQALLAAVEADPPDAVITDVRMPPDFRDEGLSIPPKRGDFLYEAVEPLASAMYRS
jgi:CheY-like chemotaxis protein